MESSKITAIRSSKKFREKNFPRYSLFGKCILEAAGGIKPGQWLATKISCTERHANLLITGQCKPSARALLALNTEILERAEPV